MQGIATDDDTKATTAKNAADINELANAVIELKVSVLMLNDLLIAGGKSPAAEEAPEVPAEEIKK
jgi:hypothetical protein